MCFFRGKQGPLYLGLLGTVLLYLGFTLRCPWVFKDLTWGNPIEVSGMDVVEVIRRGVYPIWCKVCHQHNHPSSS